MADIPDQIDDLYESRGNLLLEQFAIRADLRRVESLSARRQLEMRCSEIENSIAAIDGYIDRLVLIRAATPALKLFSTKTFTPKPQPVWIPVTPAAKVQRKSPKPKPSEQAPYLQLQSKIVATQKPPGSRKWTHSLSADTHLPLSVVPLASVKSCVPAALCDEINRRSEAMLRWAPWARRRHYLSRRYEGFR